MAASIISGRAMQCASQNPMTARLVPMSDGGVDRLRRLPAGHAVGDQPAEGRERRQRAVEDVAAGHLQDDVDRLAAVGLAQGGGERSSGRRRRAPGRRWRAAPSSSASARFSGLEAVAITRPAPQRLASWTARRADAAGAGDDDDGLALGQVRAGAQQVPGGRALQDDGQRLLVGDAVGHRPR